MKLSELIERACGELLKHVTIKEITIKLKGDKTTIVIEKQPKDEKK